MPHNKPLERAGMARRCGLIPRGPAAQRRAVSRTDVMSDDRAYVLRRRNSRGEDEYISVHVFTVAEYRCGLRAGDRLRLRRQLPGDGSGREIGGVWTVLTGSPQDPDTLWLHQPDGALHSWDDDGSIFEYFDKLAAV